MRRPMTTEELFNKIRDILKDKNKLPDILDYGLATNNPVPIRTYQFDLKSNLAYGGNEGIYLGLWIEYFVGSERRTNGIGSFKMYFCCYGHNSVIYYKWQGSNRRMENSRMNPEKWSIEKFDAEK